MLDRPTLERLAWELLSPREGEWHAHVVDPGSRQPCGVIEEPLQAPRCSSPHLCLADFTSYHCQTFRGILDAVDLGRNLRKGTVLMLMQDRLSPVIVLHAHHGYAW